jgi:peptide chain release factor subunit 3
VEEDPRQHINLVFIGHVDAGKSTLCGSILFHMGMVDPRQIERFEREAKERNRDSWFLAFIMDTSEEERAKGKTVEVGRAHFETEARRFTILDAPGHKNYVPHMISGAAQADIGCLVISARKGEFETGFEKGGQTREHATLCKTLGVNKLVVVINKMDDPTVQWSKERYDECVGKLRPFLKASGYKVKKDVIFMPLAGLSGMNVKDPVDRAVCPWIEELDFKESLLTTLSNLEITGRDALAPVVMPVLDRYAERGTVVMGKVERGTIRMGSKLTVCPTGQQVKVVQIEIKEEAVMSAKCGENVLIKVEKIDISDLKKGYVLTDSIATLPSTNFVTVQMVLIDLLSHRPIFTAGYDCIFHSHTVAEECEVMTLISETKRNKKGEETTRKNPAFVKKGSIVVCQIKLHETCIFTSFDEIEQLGRVTLRDEGMTIAIGKILSIDAEAK